jgi:hypothetical protein
MWGWTLRMAQRELMEWLKWTSSCLAIVGPQVQPPVLGEKKTKPRTKKKMQNGTEVFGLGNWEDLHSLLGSGGRGLKGSGEGGV